MTTFSIINPYSNKIIESHPYEPLPNIEETLSELNASFTQWKTTKSAHRKKILTAVSKELNKRKKELAILISTDMGKPIKEATAEVKKCIDCCHYYEKNISLIQKKMKGVNGIREPLGVILGIMPWNFPLWQIFRYLIPALMVGNTCLIKPAYNTYRIAQNLKNCFDTVDATIMDICIPTNEDAEKLIGDPRIAGVSFTGSLHSGRVVAQKAAYHLKPCVLELGGSDPFIVFKDANLDLAIENAVKARFTNAGQVCISAKRFLFDQTIYKQALRLFKEKAKKYLQYGDPINPSTTIGPLARIDLKNKLTLQLSKANIDPKNIVYQQTIDQPSGNYFSSMIINGQTLSQTNPLLTEEIFGPIAICNSFDGTDDAIEKANNTPYGLGTSLWTNDSKVIAQCTQDIECGTIAINGNVHSNFDTPFGGRKQSGLGLELGIEGALSFTGFKAIQHKK